MADIFSDNEWFRLYRYGLYLTNGNRDAAKDLVQEAVCKVLEKDLLYGKKISLSYLKKMMKNHLIDEQKKNASFTRGSVFLDLVRDGLPEYKVQNEAEQELYEKAEQFIRNHKYGYIILEMGKRGKYRIKELASYLNQSQKTLYYRYEKLTKDFKEYLEGYKL